MKDVQNRTLNEKDIVILTNNHHYLYIGVVYDGYIYYIVKNDLCRVKSTIAYKLENPTKNEKQHAESIISRITERQELLQQRKEKRKSLTRIKTKDLKIGNFYLTDTGKLVLFMGYGTTQELFTNRPKKLTRTGYIYATLDDSRLINPDTLEIIHLDNIEGDYTRESTAHFLLLLLNNMYLPSYLFPNISIVQTPLRVVHLYKENTMPMKNSFYWDATYRSIRFNIQGITKPKS